MAFSRAAQPQLKTDSPARPSWVGLVASARFGDRAAFSTLHDQFCGMVHGIIISRVRTPDAADLVQDVFLQAMQKLASLEDDAAFGGWLAQMARHRASHHLRDHQGHDELSDEVPERRGGRADEAPDAKKVLAALRTLPEAYRETLAMRLIEGLSGPEIAELTGLTPGSVRVNLHRGMEQLRSKLGLTADEVAR